MEIQPEKWMLDLSADITGWHLNPAHITQEGWDSTQKMFLKMIIKRAAQRGDIPSLSLNSRSHFGHEFAASGVGTVDKGIVGQGIFYVALFSHKVHNVLAWVDWPPSGKRSKKMETAPTLAELDAAFNRVHNAMGGHWKDRIDVILPLTKDEVTATALSIVETTATIPRITDLGKPGLLPGQRVYQIRALGYRMGPAGDH